MSQQQGFFSKEQEKAYAQLLDEAYKGKGVVEILDGYAARVFIGWMDNEILQRHVIEKFNISTELIDKIGFMSDQVLEGDLTAAADIGAEIINEFIDIPGIREDEEAQILTGMLQVIIGFIGKKAKER